jgi:RNA polymerase sigma-70 factor (ECF subfamily)
MNALALQTRSPQSSSSSRDSRPRAVRRPPAAATARAAAAAPAERQEFGAVALRHRNELYAAALRLTRDPVDADDLVQETLMRALGAWERFEPGSNCRAWLLRILTNSFINTCRRRRRFRKFAHESGDDAVNALYGEAPSRHVDPERNLVKNAVGDEVSRALGALGDDYRAVVELADLRGVRYRDIADRLGVPIGTVMSRLHRARRQLEASLEDFAAADYGIRRAG